MARVLRITASLAIATAIACSVHPSDAQQRGTDVGGQPARRKVTKLPHLTKFVEADYPPAEKAAGKGRARVRLGLLAATLDLKDLVASTEGTRPMLGSSHRRPRNPRKT